MDQLSASSRPFLRLISGTVRRAGSATIVSIGIGLGVVFVLAWVVLVRTVYANHISGLADTLSTSNLGIASTHTISYTAATSTPDGQNIKITFDPNTDLFDGVQSVVFGDLQFGGGTLVNGVGNCTIAAGEVYFASTSTTPGDESITFTVCPTDSLAAGSRSIVVSNRILNPTTTGSYVLRVTGAAGDYHDTNVAVLPDTVVSASVDSIFTFALTGAATGTVINGVTTTYASASTSLAFGTLIAGTPVTLGQHLNVTTNARNGFIVSVVEDSNPISAGGSDIDLFSNGNATSTPSPWTAPAVTLGNENTYGHFGLTSADADLNGGEFASALFAGNFQSTSSRAIFSATGSADGTTANIGSSSVAYRIQTGVLQEADSYSNRLTYIATPTF